MTATLKKSFALSTASGGATTSRVSSRWSALYPVHLQLDTWPTEDGVQSCIGVLQDSLKRALMMAILHSARRPLLRARLTRPGVQVTLSFVCARRADLVLFTHAGLTCGARTTVDWRAPSIPPWWKPCVDCQNLTRSLRSDARVASVASAALSRMSLASCCTALPPAMIAFHTAL